MSRDRDERRKFEADVYYDVWRSGRDPDRIDFDRVDENRGNGMSTEEAAAIEIKKQADGKCGVCGRGGLSYMDMVAGGEPVCLECY